MADRCNAPPPAYYDANVALLPQTAYLQQGQAPYGQVDAQAYAAQYQAVPMDKTGQPLMQPGAAYQPTVMPTTQWYGQQAAYGGYTPGPPTATYVAGAAGQPPIVVVGQPGQPYSGQNVVVVGAPSQTDPRLHSINDLLGLSIFTTLCCNLLFGIIAIVFSIRVRDAKRNNDYEAASYARRVTLILNVVGIVMTAVAIIISLCVFALNLVALFMVVRDT